MTNQTQHILMLPFMAHSHIRPFLELALRLYDRTHFTITILTTPLNANILRHKLPISATRISIVILPFEPTLHGLSPGQENTDKLPDPASRISFRKSSIALETPFRHVVSRMVDDNKSPMAICIIFDCLMGWTAPVARSFGSMAVCFSTCGAYGTAAMLSFWDNLPHCGFSYDQPFSLPGFPENHRFHRSQLSTLHRHADGSDDVSRYLLPLFRYSLEYCSGWLCNSVEELKPPGVEIFRCYVKQPVWVLGPVISSLSNTDTLSHQRDCIHWLSTQKPDFVLYISFGSQNTISSTEMMELATGLELSGKPFLWVIRPPSGFDIGEEIRLEWFPEGFKERMKDKKQGMLVRQWGPQLEILRHQSTGGFLSHCGWNSVLESLGEGVPIIGWPLGAEQVYNLRMLREDIGVAVEFEGKVCKEEVKRVAKLVLDREEESFGWKMNKKAVEMKNRLKDAARDEKEYKGSSIQAMDSFVDVISSKDKQTI